MRIYLAGPDVFFPDAQARAEAKKALVRAAGHEPLFPLDVVLDVDFENDPKPLLAEAIFASNRALIEAADVVLANLTPFRAPSADARCSVPSMPTTSISAARRRKARVSSSGS